MGKLFQASTLAALLSGNFDYTISIEYFMKNGDTGLGSYNGLNGEAVFLDGKAYNGTASGQVKVMDIPQTGVTFGQITRFAEVPPVKIEACKDYAEFKSRLDSLIAEKGKNFFYVVKAEGKFPSVSFRSGYKQRKPFRPMSIVVKEFKNFVMKDMEGTLIGVYTPEYADGLSAKGWHFHFISKDRQHAGHVTDLASEGLDVKINQMDKWEIKLPNNSAFVSSSLTLDGVKDSYEAYKNYVPSSLPSAETASDQPEEENEKEQA